MKKIIISLMVLVTLLGALPLFSAVAIDPTQNEIFSSAANPFAPTSPRMLGMGNAGLAIVSGSDSLYYNPAGLASRRATVLIGNPTVTLYHPYEILESGIIEDINMSSSESSDLGELTNKVIDILGSGHSKLADIDASVGFTAGGFGLAVNTKASINTYNVTSNGGIFAQLNASAIMGYGHRFNFTSNFSLDFGLSAGFNYWAFSDAIDVSTVMSAMQGGDMMSLFSEMPIMAGFNIPVNVGVTLNIPLNFKFSVVGRNIVPMNFMNAYDNYNGLISAPFGGNGATSYKFNSDFSIDTGLAWQWKNAFFSPAIAVDVKDLVGLFSDGFNLRNFMYHLNLGAEIRLLSFLDIRGGLNQGYWTVGAGLDLFVIKMDVAYFWQEFGVTAGDNPTDGLSIRFNIGWDR